MECELEEYGTMGRVPESGAIFMSNRETKKECLKMKTFALPSGSANFVKQVKAGMYLFLFEYEKRQLFGVYQARTDGGINLLPKTSSSSLKQYPAQVFFTPVWSCGPLSEKEFQDVIRENYYSHKKFYFGLSEDQVCKLLQLFNSRKIKRELQPKQPRIDSEPLHDLRHKLNKKLNAEKHEGRNDCPNLWIRDQGHIADECTEHDYADQINNRQSTNTFEQCGLLDHFTGSPRRMEDDDMYITTLKDHQSVHHDVPALNFGGIAHGDTLDSDKTRKDDDARYLMNSKDPLSVYHNVPALNFSGKHRGDTLGKVRQSSDSDESLLRGKVQYEDEDTTLAVSKYVSVSSDLRLTGNDMYTFVDRVVADSEHNGHPSSKSPHIGRETFSFGASLLLNDKSLTDLDSKSNDRLCDFHQDLSVGDIIGDAKCLRPNFRYSSNDTKSSAWGMQKINRHLPDAYGNSPDVVKLRSRDNRPYKRNLFESEHSMGALRDSGYSKFGENNQGGQGIDNDEHYPDRYEKLKASHSDGPIWSNELHRNSGQSYMSSRGSLGDIPFTQHNEVEGEPAMDSSQNSLISFGHGDSRQPKEDPLIYSEGPPPRKLNQESQHLVLTYPSYHESMITKSIACDSNFNSGHPNPSSSFRLHSSSSLLRGSTPYRDSGELHVGKSGSPYHPEENHKRKFRYINSENRSELQYSSTSANQDYYFGNPNNYFQNAEVAGNREPGNTVDTDRRSLLLAASPSANTLFAEDVVIACREEEKVRPYASSPHKHSSFNYLDSGHPSSSRVCERHNHNNSSGQFPTANLSIPDLYPGGTGSTNHDSECYKSRGQVIEMGNDKADHLPDVSGILKSNRRSVFARLTSGPEISIHENLDAEQLVVADSTDDEVTDMLLQLKESQLEKQGKCQMLAKHDEEELGTDHMLKSDATVDQLMNMLPWDKNYVAKKRTLARQPDGVDPDGVDPDGPLRETRLVEFKRRSEMKKKLDGSIVKRSDKAVDKKRTNAEGTTDNETLENRTPGKGTTDKPSKRRKLVRPVFVENEPVAEVHGSQT